MRMVWQWVRRKGRHGSRCVLRAKSANYAGAGIALVAVIGLLAVSLATNAGDGTSRADALGPPTGWIDITSGAVQTVYQAGVPTLQSGDHFFPNGIYFVTGGAEDEGAIPTMDAAGFTFTLGVGEWDPPTYLTPAADTNVRLLIDQSQIAHGAFDNGTPPPFNEAWFAEYKDEPRVLGWFLYNEPVGISKFGCASTPTPTPPGSSIPCNVGIMDDLETTYDNHKELTDQLFLIIDQGSLLLLDNPNWPRVATFGDVAHSYWYEKFGNPPSKASSIEPIARIVADQTQLVAESRQSWFTDQAYCCDIFGAGYPTSEKIRAQAYAAIIHGATGLFHFVWDSEWMRNHGAIGVRPDTPITYASGTPVPKGLEADSVRVWDALDTRSGPSSVNRQILALTDVLLSPTSMETYTVIVDSTPTSDAPIRTLLKEYKGDLYLLAVNLDPDVIQAQIKFDTAYHIRPLFQDSPPLTAVIGQEIGAVFQPFDTKAYRLSTCLDPDASGTVTVGDVSVLAALADLAPEAGFSDSYDIDVDYSGDGKITYKDVQIFIDDTSVALPGCGPCPGGGIDGFTDCEDLYLPSPPCGDVQRDIDKDGLGNAEELDWQTDPCEEDTDLDGCGDLSETGANAEQGGLRDPAYFWDFYDVWTRPPGDPLAWERNEVINLIGDILGVAGRFGSAGDPTGDPLVPPLDKDGYHTAFDRSGLIGPNRWDLGPPDGSINIVDDILGVAGQFGHTCA